MTCADGPERIAEEWWQPEGSGAVDAIGDYYRVEDEDGRRSWLFRANRRSGPPPRRERHHRSGHAIIAQIIEEDAAAAFLFGHVDQVAVR